MVREDRYWSLWQAQSDEGDGPPQALAASPGPDRLKLSRQHLFTEKHGILAERAARGSERGTDHA